MEKYGVLGIVLLILVPISLLAYEAIITFNPVFEGTIYLVFVLMIAIGLETFGVLLVLLNTEGTERFASALTILIIGAVFFFGFLGMFHGQGISGGLKTLSSMTLFFLGIVAMGATLIEIAHDHFG